MSANTAPERPVAVVGEVNNFAVSFDDVLDSGEAISGAPTAVENGTSDLTIASVQASTGVLAINDVAVAAGRALQFKVSGQQMANSPYRLTLTTATDATPAQTKKKYVEFLVDDE